MENGRFAEGENVKDDYYAVYAWDVVDIFFATIVASLPALNGIIDQGIQKVTTWGSSSGLILFIKLRSLTSTSQKSRGYDTKAIAGDSRSGFKVFSATGKTSASFDQHGDTILLNQADIELRSPLTNFKQHYAREC